MPNLDLPLKVRKDQSSLACPACPAKTGEAGRKFTTILNDSFYFYNFCRLGIKMYFLFFQYCQINNLKGKNNDCIGIDFNGYFCYLFYGCFSRLSS